MKKDTKTIIAAFLFSLAMVVLGYLSSGTHLAVAFIVALFGGFIVWLLAPVRTSFSCIKLPYWLAFTLFILHIVEEEVFGFSHSHTEDVSNLVSVASTLLAFVWLFSPLLVKYGYAFGYFGAWSFFIAFGVVELGHIFLPFFTSDGYEYVPGMASVVLLAPVAWWGMWRLWNGDKSMYK